MSKKNQKKSNVKSSILVLLLIAILLIASTYAWFTANTKVTISTLDVNVKAQNGLQISADGADWKTILQNTDIDPTNVSKTYSGNTNQIPSIMEPVSSVGKIATDGTMEMFYGTVTQSDAGTSQLTASKTTDTKGAGDKAGQYRKRDYHGERKGRCTEPPQKVQRYDRVARNRRHWLFLSGYADRNKRSS